MKTYRLLLLVLATIFAPVVASAANITINSLGGNVADFHPVFNGSSDTSVGSFSVNTGTGSTPFTVVVDKKYDVTKLVNSQVVKIGTVSWNASGVATYVPAP